MSLNVKTHGVLTSGVDIFKSGVPGAECLTGGEIPIRFWAREQRRSISVSGAEV